MARTKQVLVVGIGAHTRIVERLRQEIEAWRAVAESTGGEIDDIRRTVEQLMTDVRHVARHRANLRARRDMVLAACGRPGCRSLIYRRWSDIGSTLRRCARCADADHRAFVAAHVQVLETPPMSPINFLATGDNDTEETLSI
jgi:hypothetical protein